MIKRQLRDGSSVTSNQEEYSRAHAAWSYANAQVTDFKLGFLPLSSSNFVFISLEIQLQSTKYTFPVELSFLVKEINQHHLCIKN